MKSHGVVISGAFTASFQSLEQTESSIAMVAGKSRDVKVALIFQGFGCEFWQEGKGCSDLLQITVSVTI